MYFLLGLKHIVVGDTTVIDVVKLNQSIQQTYRRQTVELMDALECVYTSLWTENSF